MPSRPRLYLLGATVVLALCGCVQLPPDRPRLQQVDPAVSNEVLASAASQVRRCYRSPRVDSSGKQIVTRLRIQLNSDGTLAALPQLVSQSGVTPFSRPYAARMAEAASLAVIRCAPLQLPPEHFQSVWQHFELNFSPGARA
jgi:hypothetical protein